jgi:hypothetical protein
MNVKARIVRVVAVLGLAGTLPVLAAQASADAAMCTWYCCYKDKTGQWVCPGH